MAEPLEFKRLDFLAALAAFVYASGVVVTPIVLLSMAEDIGFGFAEAGGIEGVRAGLLVAMLVGSGFAAARWGKVTVLCVGGLVFGAGFFIYSVASAYSIVLLGMVLVGLGSGLLEALINPLVQDVHEHNSGRYLNIVTAFSPIGVLVATVVAGELLTAGASWRIIVALTGLLATLSGLLFLLLGRGSPRPPRTRGSARNTVHEAKIILREPAFWIYAVAIFCGGGAEGGFTFWSATYVQINFDALARAGAIGTAVFAGGMVTGRLLFGRFVHQEGLPTLMIVSAAVGTVLSVATYLVGNLAGFYLLLFGAGVSIACFWPSIQSNAAAVMTVNSTMLFILLSIAGIAGFGLTSLLMGVVAELSGLKAGLLVLPALLQLLVVAMIVANLRHRSGRRRL